MRILLCALLSPLSACSYSSGSDGTTLHAEEQSLFWGIQRIEDRRIETRDLVTLRDIGGYSGAISLSPDGQKVAFFVHRKDLDANDYATGWFVAPTDVSRSATYVGDRGDIILVGEESGRIAGGTASMKAQWSPNSKWIGYRRKNNDDGIQLWLSSWDGDLQQQLTSNPGNVKNFVWSADGRRILFSTGTSRSERHDALLTEGEEGYLFDDRFFLLDGTAPVFEDPAHADPFKEAVASHIWVYEIENGNEYRATPEEEQEYRQRMSAIRPINIGDDRVIQQSVTNTRGQRFAWIENEDPLTFAGRVPPLTLYATLDGGAEVKCAAAECTGRLEHLSWGANDDVVYFGRREGVNFIDRGIYAWRPGEKDVRTVLQTSDWIEDCQLAASRLICLHESSTTPRRIVAIETNSGELMTLVDPNPEFHNIRLSEVERLEWKEASGAEAVGHLVYPVGYEDGQRYPLVIVQYRSRGFLRGGVGDEYPIHPLAANGFFVLSFDRPEKHDVLATIGATYDAEKQYWGASLWGRTSALSALEIVIDMLDQRALIDPAKVGITGLSDGAETVWYAMINSHRFAAAAASDGGWSPSWYYLMNAAVRKNYLNRSAELQPPGMGTDVRWRRISPQFHAEKIHTPILVQVADRELIASASSIGALQEAGKPIEAYVFPNEYHVKWQPKHKLAIYERTIDWFSFWLRNIEDPDPEKAAQYARWRKMRDERCARSDLKPASYCQS